MTETTDPAPYKVRNMLARWMLVQFMVSSLLPFAFDAWGITISAGTADLVGGGQVVSGWVLGAYITGRVAETVVPYMRR